MKILRKALKKFTAKEASIIIKIIIKQGIFKENIATRMEKLKLDGKCDIKCKCGLGIDNFIHKIKTCPQHKVYATKLKKIKSDKWFYIKQPIELINDVNSEKEMVEIIKYMLLFLKKIGKIRINLSHDW